MTPLQRLNVGHIVFATLLVLGIVRAHADTIRVSKDRATGEDTYATIQDAINAASDGDTVIVSPGTYQENIDFLGKAITVVSKDWRESPRDSFRPDKTFIEADVDAGTVAFWRGEGGEGREAKLIGFTITGGESGEAIRCMDSSPAIENCQILGQGIRPTIHCERGSPKFNRCEVGLTRAVKDVTVLARCLDTTASFAHCAIIQPIGADPYGALQPFVSGAQYGLGQDVVLRPAYTDRHGRHFVAEVQALQYRPGDFVRTVKPWAPALPSGRARPFWDPPDPRFERPPASLDDLLKRDWTILTEPQRKRIQQFRRTCPHLRPVGISGNDS